MVDGERLERDRGDVVEWYANHPDRGLEQGVILKRVVLSEAAPVFVAWTVDGSMAPRASRFRAGLLFFRERAGPSASAAWLPGTPWGRSMPVALELPDRHTLRYVLNDAGGRLPGDH